MVVMLGQRRMHIERPDAQHYQGAEQRRGVAVAVAETVEIPKAGHRRDFTPSVGRCLAQNGYLQVDCGSLRRQGRQRPISLIGISRRALAVLGLVFALGLALLCVAWLGSASAVAAEALLPNIVADPPDNVSLETSSTEGGLKGGGEAKLLLRFNGYIHNVGPGALDFRGSRKSAAEPMKAFQRVYSSDGSFKEEPSSAELVYVSADGHQHWHLQRVARYSLWNAARSAEVAPAQKVGFCLDDSEHVEPAVGPSEAVYSDATGREFCRQHQPEATSLFEGVSRGWRDLYKSNLAFQWVDASEVLPGEYWLREDVNTTGVVKEAGGANAPSYATKPTVISGFDAIGQAIGVQAEEAHTVTLTSKAWNDAATPRYTIKVQPQHGTLGPVTNNQVAYTPQPGYSGPDSFTFAAADPSSPFPRSPGTATVSIEVAKPSQPSVTIEGLPSSIAVGASVQLSARVAGDAPEVSWVASTGTITAGGLYTAPASVPPGGSATITATSAKGAHDQRTVEITPSRSLLAGDASSGYSDTDQTPAGHEEAFKFTAQSSGAVEELQFRTDSQPSPGITGLSLGLFADDAGKPGAVLALGAAPGRPPTETWIRAAVPRADVLAGTPYWLVVLPLGEGQLHFNAAQEKNAGTPNLESVAGELTQATAELEWNTENRGPVGFEALGAPASVESEEAPRTASLSISGAQEEMIVGTGVTLTAVLGDDSGGVEWTVSAGTITHEGSTALYIAPASPGTVTVSAHLKDAPVSVQKVIRVVAAPTPAPAPAPENGSGSGGQAGYRVSSATPGVSRPRVILVGRQLVMTTRATVAGRVRLSAYLHGHRLGTCVAETPAGRSFTCRLHLHASVALSSRIRIVASLRAGRTVVQSVLTAGRIPQMR